jgi:hypothetical protein
MPNTPKPVQLIAAPGKFDVTRSATMSAQHSARITDPVIALALMDDGGIRAVYIDCLKDDNVGRLAITSENAIFSPPLCGKRKKPHRPCHNTDNTLLALRGPWQSRARRCRICARAARQTLGEADMCAPPIVCFRGKNRLCKSRAEGPTTAHRRKTAALTNRCSWLQKQLCQLRKRVTGLAHV